MITKWRHSRSVLSGNPDSKELDARLRTSGMTARRCANIYCVMYKSGFPPGTVVKVEGEDVPARFMTRISPHQLGLSDLLAAAALTGELPRQVALFGMEPQRVELGLEMTDEVKGSFEKLLEIVVDQLKTIGCAPEALKESAFGKESIWRNVIR